MKRPTLPITIAAALGIVALVVMIVMSSLEMSLLKGLRETVDTRWGVTTMVDLYLGLFAVAGWIAYRERSVPRSIAWFVALCLLGNLATLAYILIVSLRAGSLEEFFRPRPR